MSNMLKVIDKGSNRMSNVLEVIESGVKYGVHTFDDGTQAWWKDGKRHRLDDFAREFITGDREWWLNGLLVYSDLVDFTANHKMTDKMKLSIVKYRLSRE